ncbi:hypothetical protein LTR66_002690 [Elasticomyces elasticus]|nr:hypothetical protein LTR66_002690 [Elasticomyces elasticus]
MVKVLANSAVDLDLFPGKSQQDVAKEAQVQVSNATAAVQQQADVGTNNAQKSLSDAQGQAHSGLDIAKDKLPDSMTAEQKEQARGIAGTVVDGAGNVVGGLAGTVGGVVKNLGDTAGNTVYGLGSGLGTTGMDTVKGLGNTATAPFSGGKKDAGSEKKDAGPEKKKDAGAEKKVEKKTAESKS